MWGSIVRLALIGAALLAPGLSQARIIIKTFGASHAQVMAGVAAAAPGKVVRHISGLSMSVMTPPPGMTDLQLLAIVKRMPGVKFAEIDGYARGATNDPYYNQEWYLGKIGAQQGWGLAGGRAVTVAVLDSGVGPVADIHTLPGWNIMDNNADTTDVNGHGTMVAGTLGALCNNGVDLAGVACAVNILPVRVANQNKFALYSDMVSGIQWAVAHGARVINLSYYPVVNSQAVADAANWAWSQGVPVVVASGNDGTLDNYPAVNGLIAVGATDENDSHASFSDYGPFVTLAAPGTDIPIINRDGSVSTDWGTSFSAPMVSATIAEMLSVNPSLTPDQERAILERTAVNLGNSSYFGAGRLNTAAAVAAAAGMSGATAPPSNPQATRGALPDFSFISPASGSAVSSPQTVAIASSNGDAFHRVQFWVDGQLLNDYTGGSFTRYRIAWQGMAAGAHVLKIEVFDGQGNWRWRQERVYR